MPKCGSWTPPPACASQPDCTWGSEAQEPVAPTLAKYVDPDGYPRKAAEDLSEWARQNLPVAADRRAEPVELTKCLESLPQIAATLLYSATGWPFQELHEMTAGWSRARQAEASPVPPDVPSRALRTGMRVTAIRSPVDNSDNIAPQSNSRSLYWNRTVCAPGGTSTA